MKTWVEKLDKYRPLSDVFDLCYEDPMAVFLDSSLKGTLGRWSIIGLSPFLTLEEVDGKCYQNGEEVTLSFEETLEIYLKENITFFIVRNQIFVCPFLFEISDKR